MLAATNIGKRYSFSIDIYTFLSSFFNAPYFFTSEHTLKEVSLSQERKVAEEP